MIFALVGSTTTDPIARDGWSSVRGTQLAPRSLDLQTPPRAAPMYKVLVLLGAMAMELVRPASRVEPLVSGAGPRNSQIASLAPFDLGVCSTSRHPCNKLPKPLSGPSRFSVSQWRYSSIGPSASSSSSSRALAAVELAASNRVNSDATTSKLLLSSRRRTGTQYRWCMGSPRVWSRRIARREPNANGVIVAAAMLCSRFNLSGAGAPGGGHQSIKATSLIS